MFQMILVSGILVAFSTTQEEIMTFDALFL
jgi:hypothetical protein